MKTSTIAWAALIIIVVVGGGWYWYSTQQSPSGSAGLNGSPNQGNLGQADNGTPQAPAPTVLALSSNTAAGSFMMAPLTGMALYTFSNDTAGVSNCTEQCAANWPPYLVEPGITLTGAAGISGQLGTITRADGSTQLTYKGAPLYTYIKDTKPGDTNGQGVGGVWFVVKP